jgi:tRNA pseudouridine(38-40) synthase
LNIPWFKFNLNRVLIDTNRTMRVIDARFVHDAFEPKLAAIQRTYLYRFIADSSITVIEQPLSTYVSSPISLSLLRSAISLVHNRLIDYSLFTSSEARALLKNTHRIVGIQLSEPRSLFANLKSNPPTSFCLQLTCTNFLHQMVRRLTTELVQVAQGQLSLKQFEEKLNSSNDKQLFNNPTNLLDINGLYLQNVMYDEQDFQRYVTYTTLTTMKNKLYPLAPVLTGEE